MPPRPAEGKFKYTSVKKRNQRIEELKNQEDKKTRSEEGAENDQHYLTKGLIKRPGVGYLHATE